MNNGNDIRETLISWNSEIKTHITSLQKDVNEIHISTFKKIRAYYKKSDKEVEIKDTNDFEMYAEAIISRIHENPIGTYKISIEDDMIKNITIPISELAGLYVKNVRVLKNMCSERYYDEIKLLKKYIKSDDYKIAKKNLHAAMQLKIKLSSLYKQQIILYLRLIKKNLKERSVQESTNTLVSRRIRNCIDELKL